MHTLRARPPAAACAESSPMGRVLAMMVSSFELVALACALLLALPASGWAQADKPRVGWILSTTAQGSQHLAAAIHAGLADEGLVDGRNVVLDLRFADGKMERYPGLFADILRQPVQVLAAAGLQGIGAARDASAGRLPVVGFFCGNDVVEMVAEFARPGGNITGVSCLSSELAVKRVELLRQAVPGARRVGLLYDAKNRGKEREIADTRDAAAHFGMELVVAAVRSAEELPEAFAALRRERADALIVSEEPFTFAHRVRIMALANEHRLPNVAAFRDFVVAGGLMTYGASVTERLRHQARYVARVLKGSKPADLPVDQAARFEFVINRRAAQSLGVSLPQTLLIRADEVIE